MLIGYYSDNPNGFVTGKLFSADLPCVTVMRAGMGGDSLGHWHLLRDGRKERDVPRLNDDGIEYRVNIDLPPSVKAGKRLMQRDAVLSKPSPAITCASPGNDTLLKISVDAGADLPSDKPLYRVPLMAEVAAVSWNGLTVASTFSGCGGSCTGYRMAGFRVGWANEFVPAAQDSYNANKAAGSILDGRDVKMVQPEEVLNALKIERGQLDLFDGSPPCQAFSTAGKRQKGWGKKKSYEGGHEQLNETLFGEWLRLLRGLMPRTFVAENVSGLVKGVCKGTFLEILAEMKAAGYRVSARVLDAQWLGVPQQRQRVIFVGVRDDLIDKETGLPLQPCHPSPLSVRYSVREAIPWISGTTSGESGFGGKMLDDAASPTDGRAPLGKWKGHGVKIVQQQGSPGMGKKPVSDARPLLSICSSQAQQFVLSREVEPELRIVGVNRSTQWEDGVRFDGPNQPHPVLGASPSTGCGKAGGAKIELALPHGATERRKFTIAELRRLCAFPDDFVLTGSYAQQWERLGNSVPPVMAFWVARTVRDRVLLAADGRESWPHDPACLTAVAEARKS